MARRTLDLGLYVPPRAGRDVTETITGSDQGELVRDANGDLFMLRIPGQADKLTVEYSGTGDWATPAFSGLQRGDVITVQLMGWNVDGDRRSLTGMVDSLSVTFTEMKQVASWSLRIIEV